MQNIFEKFSLQFFAEGVSGEEMGAESSAGVDTAAAGQTEGVTSAAAEQNITKAQTRSLEDLGVPKDKAERYRARRKNSAQTIAAESPVAEPQRAAAAEQPVAPKAETTPKPTWDELMKDPEYKRKMSEIVTARVKDMQGRLDAMAPAMELLGNRAGMDVTDLNKLDYAALNKAIVDDDIFYEAGANAAGKDIESYKRDVQKDSDYNARVRELSRREEDFKATLEQIAARNYQDRLNADAAELKKEFPGFDLEKEMANPRFKAMVAPGGGFTLADAYYALHRKEIREAIVNETAQQVKAALTRSFQSGRQMPVENGSRGAANTPVGPKLYSQMNDAERKAYKEALQRRSKF